MDEAVTLSPMAVARYSPVTIVSSLMFSTFTLPLDASTVLSGVSVKSGVTVFVFALTVNSLSLAPSGMFLSNVTVHVGADGILNFTSSPVILLSSISNCSSPTTSLYHALSLP